MKNRLFAGTAALAIVAGSAGAEQLTVFGSVAGPRPGKR